MWYSKAIVAGFVLMQIADVGWAQQWVDFREFEPRTGFQAQLQPVIPVQEDELPAVAHWYEHSTLEAYDTNCHQSET